MSKDWIRRRLLLLVVKILLAGSVYLLFQWILGVRKAPVRYKAFGIDMPSGYTIHGIDVSKYQSRIRWEEVRAMQVGDIRLKFSFIKATEGVAGTDPHFRRNWESARKAGLIRGAYHFFIASSDGKAQARHFAAQADLQPGDLPPVLDVEQLNGASPAQLQQQVLAWLQETEKILGVRPILYTNADFYRRFLGSVFDDYPLWVAHYYQPEQPQIGRDWLFWQHSDKGHVNGIRGEVDFNVFNGNMEDLQGLLIR